MKMARRPADYSMASIRSLKISYNRLICCPPGEFHTCEERLGAVGQQHPQIPIPAFGNPAQFAGIARGEFLRHQPKPTGRESGILEMADLATGRRHHRCGGQEPDTGNGQQLGAGRTLPGQGSQQAKDCHDRAAFLE